LFGDSIIIEVSGILIGLAVVIVATLLYVGNAIINSVCDDADRILESSEK
jgi:hypothetical protein